MRREAAVAAAREVAYRHGIVSNDPRVLKDSNNTIVHLAPAPLVAKVCTTALPGGHQALEREMAVLGFLAQTSAPTVHPSLLLPPGPHQLGDQRMIFLEHLPTNSADSVDAHEAVQALVALHGALRDYTQPLPEFADSMGQAGCLLVDESALPQLSCHERSFLIGVHRELTAALPAGRSRWQALHGDPWAGGNLLATPGGAIFVDLEAACLGPIEWDYSALDDVVADASPAALDRRLLDLLRAWRSLTVAVWCWCQLGRAPEVDEAARWHLRLLHERVGR